MPPGSEARNHADTPAPPLNWPTISFIVGTTLAALVWPLYAWFYGVTVAEMSLAFAYFVATGMAITVGYHRLVSHRTFRCRPWMKAVLLVVGSAAWQGSALEWGTEHLRHHAHIDTDGDPYNRKRGFWYAHIGWLFRKGVLDRDEVPEWLASDKVVVWQDRWYTPLAVTTSFLIPWALCGVGGLLLVGAVRLVLLHHVTWFINSWAHTGTHRPYNPRVTAVDNWFLAFVTFGEGWHNYHHAFPGDYRNGVEAWDWDPSKWMIYSMAKLGIAHDLQRTRPSLLWRRRVDTVLGHAGEEREKLVAQTRERLETMSRQAHERLRVFAAKAAARGDEEVAAFHEWIAAHELPEMPTVDVDHWRRRMGEAAKKRRAARHSRKADRAQRMQAMLEQLSAYRTQLERLAAPSGTAQV